jgi:hypothetical protein
MGRKVLLFLFKMKKGWAWWYVYVISATQEVEMWKMVVGGHSGKIKKASWWYMCVAPAMQCMQVGGLQTKCVKTPSKR